MPTRPPTHKPIPQRVWRDPRLNLPLDPPKPWHAGYDREWERFRKRILAQHPFCADCLRRGQMTPARDVHHIKKLRDFPQFRLDPRNVMTLCIACHSDRTNRGE
jgi:5-methylcytosine-specific restriction endonuclease McrA